MITVLVGIAALGIILWALGVFTRADPKGLAQGARVAGGVVALAGAAVLLFRGQIAFALPLGVTGLGLLGWMPWKTAWGQRTQKKAGQSSHVRSTFIEMELDHDTGRMRGQFVAGRHAGVALDALEVATLIAVLTEIDEESRALLAAYLDRRDTRWREHADAGATAGQTNPPRSGKMTQEEAYQILGLHPGATAAEIGQAHRSLMKKLHPDQGGSTYLAARINEAKDVLLRRHH